MFIKMHKAYRTLNRIEKETPYITLEVQGKERRLRVKREKDQVIYKGTPIRIIPAFSVETLKVVRAYLDLLTTSSDKRPQVIYIQQNYHL